MHRLPLAAAVAVLAVGAAPATSWADACPKLTAKRASGSLIDHHQKAPDGEELEGRKVRFPGHFFEATSDVVLRTKGNKATISEGSIFKLSCYGRAKGAPLWPAVDLLRGDVDVHSGRAKPLGVITHEGLYDPREVHRMHYTIARTTVKDELDPGDMFSWFGNTVSQPRGVTEVESNTKGVIVGVTPYVGERKGSCRYVKSARLSSEPGDSGATYDEG